MNITLKPRRNDGRNVCFDREDNARYHVTLVSQRNRRRISRPNLINGVLVFNYCEMQKVPTIT